MKRKPLLHCSIYVLVGVMLLPAGCAPREETDAEAVTAAVNEIWSQYSSSLNSGDIDAWVALWAEDGIQMPPNSPPVVGKQRIRERNKAVLDRFSFDMSITNEEVEAAGDWAYSRGTYMATLTPRQGGEPVFIDGKYMTILQRQSDGSWKIRRDIFNSNVPPAEN